MPSTTSAESTDTLPTALSTGPGLTIHRVGGREFVLDRTRAEAALAVKRVVGGRETMTFNLLPLRHGWADELYRTTKADHWERYRTAFQIPADALIDATARRQKWIDQSHSLNLFLAAPDMRTMSHMYRRAWRSAQRGGGFSALTTHSRSRKPSER